VVYTDVINIINVSFLLYIRTRLDAKNCVYLKPLVSVMESYDSSSSFISQLCFTIFLPLFYVLVTVHHNKFFVIKPTRCTNFTNLFWHETLLVSGSSILVMLEICLQTCMTYTIAKCTVLDLLMMDRGTVRSM